MSLLTRKIFFFSLLYRLLIFFLQTIELNDFPNRENLNKFLISKLSKIEFSFGVKCCVCEIVLQQEIVLVVKETYAWPGGLQILLFVLFTPHDLKRFLLLNVQIFVFLLKNFKANFYNFSDIRF